MKNEYQVPFENWIIDTKTLLDSYIVYEHTDIKFFMCNPTDYQTSFFCRNKKWNICILIRYQ